MIRHDDPTALPLLLHLNSEPWLNQDAYAATSAEVPFPALAPAADGIALPPASRGPDGLTAIERDAVADGIAPSLWREDATRALRALIDARRSVRRFAARPLPLATLSALLAGTYGTGAATRLADGTVALRRPVPSAGALYPLELRLLLTHVDGAADGVWRYEPLHHRLEPIGRLPAPDALDAMLLVQPYLAGANALVFLCGNLDRPSRKYGMRSYRYLLLEAGHAAQNLCLLAVAAGLGSLCIGGFRDRGVNAALGLQRGGGLALYGVALGAPG